MQSIARMLEISLATTNEAFGRREIRRNDIKELKSPAKRLGALAVDELAWRNPHLATNVLDFLSRRLIGLKFLGFGSEYSVYGNRESVIKAHRDSANWSEADRLEYVATKKIATDLLCECMGSMAVSQSYRVGDHPFGRYRVVIAEQAFVDGEELPVFTINQPSVNRQVVSKYCESVPSGQAALEHVIEATHLLYDREHMVPDTNGTGNLVVVGPERHLTIIDPQPVTDAVATDCIRRQVDSLAEFLVVA